MGYSTYTFALDGLEGRVSIQKAGAYTPDDEDLRFVVREMETRLDNGEVGPDFTVNDLTVTIEFNGVSGRPVLEAAFHTLTQILSGKPDPATQWTTMPPNRDEMIAILKEAGWPDDLLSDALCIAGKESGWSPTAYNGDDPEGGSAGLFQINRWWSLHDAGIPRFDWDRRFEPVYNAEYALKIRLGQGRWGDAWVKSALACGLK